MEVYRVESRVLGNVQPGLERCREVVLVGDDLAKDDSERLKVLPAEAPAAIAPAWPVCVVVPQVPPRRGRVDEFEAGGVRLEPTEVPSLAAKSATRCKVRRARNWLHAGVGSADSTGALEPIRRLARPGPLPTGEPPQSRRDKEPIQAHAAIAKLKRQLGQVVTLPSAQRLREFLHAATRGRAPQAPGDASGGSKALMGPSWSPVGDPWRTECRPWRCTFLASIRMEPPPQYFAASSGLPVFGYPRRDRLAVSMTPPMLPLKGSACCS